MAPEFNYELCYPNGESCPKRKIDGITTHLPGPTLRKSVLNIADRLLLTDNLIVSLAMKNPELARQVIPSNKSISAANQAVQAQLAGILEELGIKESRAASGYIGSSPSTLTVEAEDQGEANRLIEELKRRIGEILAEHGKTMDLTTRQMNYPQMLKAAYRDRMVEEEIDRYMKLRVPMSNLVSWLRSITTGR